MRKNFLYIKEIKKKKILPLPGRPVKLNVSKTKLIKLVPPVSIFIGLIIISGQLIYPYLYFSTKAEETTAETLPEDFSIPRNAIPETGKEREVEQNGSKDPEQIALSIPKLGIINSELFLDVDGSKKEIYNPVLKKGIAHYLGTVLPGNNGISVLFAHSSFPWVSDTKEGRAIFSRLSDLKVKDSISISRGNRKLQFLVEEIKVIKPKDLGLVLGKVAQEKPTIVLLTCVPPGQNTFRLLVFASPIE